MKIHHLNCGTFCPRFARLVQGTGGFFERGRMVCHCLLVESDDGLVLVDTGIGTHDVRDPSRLGRTWVRRTAPRLDPAETALAQIERLGFRAADVRHLIPTHLDLDHAGGLADFPHAEVHVHVDEHRAVTMDPRTGENRRGRPSHWAHGPRWNLHAVDGERWFGFDAVRPIPGLGDGVLLVALGGHSAGHCGVAVKTGDGYVLHAGDAYFSHLEMRRDAPSCPPLLAYFQSRAALDDGLRRANQARLRALSGEHPEVTVVSAHCATEFDREVARTGSGHVAGSLAIG